MYYASGDLEQDIIKLATNTVLIACLVLIGGALLTVYLNKKHKNVFKQSKLLLFLLMTIPIVGTTLLLFSSTVYLNVKSESGGPVHWHTDIEFWACGAELELRDPTGALSNKIGTATYHEHNDKRIHLEGVVVRKDTDASLKKFMEVTGGYINHDSIGMPLNGSKGQRTATTEHQDGDVHYPDRLNRLEQFISRQNPDRPVLELNNGRMGCNGQTAELQTFVYRYNKENKTYTQTKLADPSQYIMRDESTIPPGDCVIVEFDVPKNRTGKLCEQYGVRDSKRCVEFGVHEFNPELCNVVEVDGNGAPL